MLEIGKKGKDAITCGSRLRFLCFLRMRKERLSERLSSLDLAPPLTDESEVERL